MKTKFPIFGALSGLILAVLSVYVFAFFKLDVTENPAPSGGVPTEAFAGLDDLIFAALVVGSSLILTVISSSIGLLRKEKPVFSIIPLLIATPVLAYMLLIIIRMR